MAGFRKIIVTLLIAPLFVNAQDSLTKYPFINPMAGKLILPKDSSLMDSFYRKVEALSKNQRKSITIVHIGGSHVQAGIWSNEFADKFREWSQTKGGGYFVFPYRLGKTNGQPFATTFSENSWKLIRPFANVSGEYLGMSALCLESKDSICQFGLTLREPSAVKKVNEVRVYHNFAQGYAIELENVPQGLQVREDDVKKGYTVFKLLTTADSLLFKATRTDSVSTFRLYGMRVINDSLPGVVLAPLGANGASTRSFLKSKLFVPQLKTLEPDLVIISLGVNDVQSVAYDNEVYKENYDSLITLIRLASPEAAIVLTTTTDNYIKKRTANKRTARTRDVMLDMLEQEKVAVWDLYTVMGGYKSILKWQKAGLASYDRVHFNAKGYTILGRLMFQSIRNASTQLQ
jgi:lysophospholipase L1-like esterase